MGPESEVWVRVWGQGLESRSKSLSQSLGPEPAVWVKVWVGVWGQGPSLGPPRLHLELIIGSLKETFKGFLKGTLKGSLEETLKGALRGALI